MLAAILKNKVDENHLGTEKILRAENRVKIRYRLGEEAGHTRGHVDKGTSAQAHKRTSAHTDARRVSPKELRN